MGVTNYLLTRMILQVDIKNDGPFSKCIKTAEKKHTDILGYPFVKKHREFPSALKKDMAPLGFITHSY